MYTILYVDDEEALLEIGSRFLERDGTMSVRTLESAREALLELESGRFDAVISDYMMPDMDGIEFLKSVRSRYPKLPFILFTGRGRETVVIEAINHGVDFYLQKGGDPSSQFAELAHKVRMAIERRRAEKALGHEILFNQAIFDSVPGILYLYDAEGRLVRWNRNHETVTGYSAEELAGRYVLDWFPDEHDKKVIQDGIETALRDGRASWQARIQTRSGERIPFFFTARRLEIEGKVYFTGIGVDITERQRAEEALHASEEKFRGISERSSDLIYVENAKGQITYVSPSVTRILGYTPDEVIGTQGDLFVAEEDRQKIRDGRISKQEGDTFENFIIHVRRKDGTLAELDLQAIPIVRNGAFLGLQVIGREVTGRRKAEQALRESEERFRAFTENSLDTIMLFDRELRHLYVNPIIIKGFGIPPSEYIGKTHREMGFPDHLVRLWEDSLREVFRTGRPGEVELQLPSGVWADWLLVPIHGQDGSVTQVLASARVITKKKLVEETLRRTNRQLNLLNAVTRHDILNQVTVIMANLDHAESEHPAPGMEKFYQVLRSAAELIRNQIEFTRVYEDIGSQEPRWQDVPALLARQPVPEGVTLVQDISYVEIFADPMLEKVFYNLIDNSARHGGNPVEVRVTGAEEPEGYRILFSDNGKGIPDKEKEKIFVRGFGKNTGLGLFLVREILSITGITIRETGVEGGGARFEILVPPGAYRFGERLT